MPELPEVETVRRGMEAKIVGARLERLELRRPDLRWPFPEGLSARVEGGRVTLLRRRSKYILIDLDRGETLILHLGMSGRILIDGADGAPLYHEGGGDTRHDHVVFGFEGGVEVRFNDARRFGVLDISRSVEVENHPLLAHLGPEPLGNGFDAAYLAHRLQKSRTPIKAALLDQRVVAGLGNIYVSEALHRSGISPRRRAGRISAARLDLLIRHIRDVLSEAIEAGGSSLRDYRQSNGELGYFQHRFRVYDREGHPCPNDGCAGSIRRIVQSGRSTFYCPACQR